MLFSHFKLRRETQNMVSNEQYVFNSFILVIKLESAYGNITESLMLVHDLQVLYIHFISLSEPDCVILTFSYRK